MQPEKEVEKEGVVDREIEKVKSERSMQPNYIFLQIQKSSLSGLLWLILIYVTLADSLTA